MSVDLTTPSASGLLQSAQSYWFSLRNGAVDCVALMLGIESSELKSEFLNVPPASRNLIVGLSAWIGIVGFCTAGELVYAQSSSSSDVVALRPIETKLVQRSQKTFDAIVQRSLFSKSRQSSAVAPFETVQEQKFGTLDRSVGLKGVMINGNFAKAFLISGQSPVGAWRAIGEQFVGWRVEEITRDHVVLASDSDRLTVPLSFAKR